MKKAKKTSFALSFTMLSLLLILTVKFVMSIMFFNYLRSVVVDLTEFNARENVSHSRELILKYMNEHERVLENTAIGLTFLLRNGNTNTVREYLGDMLQSAPNSLNIYFTNNRVWNQSGGFAVFGDGWIPEADWDNTSRPWFIEAKKARGQIAFSQPYIDSDTGDIVITLSKTVFDKERDLGVIAYDVRVNDLTQIINSTRLYDEHEIYIINAQGLFVTNDDINAVMQKDFFVSSNLEEYREYILNYHDFFYFNRNFFIYSSIVPHTDWVLVSLIPADIIFAGVNSFIMRLIVFTVIVFACVTVVTVVFAHRKITIPLLNTVKLADKIAKALAGSDFGVKEKDSGIYLTKFRNDEIGEIQQALIKIRDKLKTGIDSLQDHIDKKH